MQKSFSLNNMGQRVLHNHEQSVNHIKKLKSIRVQPTMDVFFLKV